MISSKNSMQKVMQAVDLSFGLSRKLAQEEITAQGAQLAGGELNRAI
jgi:hypothetical protein